MISVYLLLDCVGKSKKEHFVLQNTSLRFIFSERFVLRIIFATRRLVRLKYEKYERFWDVIDNQVLMFIYCSSSSAFHALFRQKQSYWHSIHMLLHLNSMLVVRQ